MSKQIKTTARGLAALGRGNDKMLVHMTPGEVAGLQKLARATGGSLTINPKTGLPEAGYLSALLPMIAAGAATVMTGGTATPLLMAAIGAGAGAVGAKVEGEDPVMAGAMGALGGLGGSGLASSLTKAGAATAQGAVNAGLTQASNAAAQGAAASTGQAAGQGIVSGALNPTAQNIAAAGMQNGVQPIAQQAAQEAAKSQIPATLASPGRLSNYEAFKAGIGSLAEPGGATPSSIASGLTNTEKMGLATTAMGAASGSGSSGGGGKHKNPLYYSTSASIDPNGYVSFGPGMWSKKYNYETLGTYNPDDDTKYATAPKKYQVAEGGSIPSPEEDFSSMLKTRPQPPVDTSANDDYVKYLNELVKIPPPQPSKPYQQPQTAALTSTLSKKQAKRVPMSNYSFDSNTGVFSKMKSGGLAGLTYAAGGKLIRGKGDGVSDGVPAVIKGKRRNQKAALADGEFVIPARHVSELGNGSTEAGARVLYAMLKRIEQKRKSTAYAADSGARKVLPA